MWSHFEYKNRKHVDVKSTHAQLVLNAGQEGDQSLIHLLQDQFFLHLSQSVASSCMLLQVCYRLSISASTVPRLTLTLIRSSLLLLSNVRKFDVRISSELLKKKTKKNWRILISVHLAFGYTGLKRQQQVQGMRKTFISFHLRCLCRIMNVKWQVKVTN